jgi:hypothetical protein
MQEHSQLHMATDDALEMCTHEMHILNTEDVIVYIYDLCQTFSLNDL